MADSLYTKVETVSGVSLSRIIIEKVSDREAPIVLNEITNGSLVTRHRVALDFSKVTMLTSAGIGMLVSLNKTCKSAGGALCAFGISPDIMQVLRITNLHRIVAMADSEDAAIKKVAP